MEKIAEYDPNLVQKGPVVVCGACSKCEPQGLKTAYPRGVKCREIGREVPYNTDTPHNCPLGFDSLMKQLLHRHPGTGNPLGLHLPLGYDHALMVDAVGACGNFCGGPRKRPDGFCPLGSWTCSLNRYMLRHARQYDRQAPEPYDEGPYTTFPEGPEC